MGSRMIGRVLVPSSQQIFLIYRSWQQRASHPILIHPAQTRLNARHMSVFNEFSKRVKGEVQSNPELQKSIKELKEKAGELKGMSEDLKVRTKQTTEHLYKHADAVRVEAEAKAKQVSAAMKDKFSAVTEQAKEFSENFKRGADGSSETTTDSGGPSNGFKYEEGNAPGPEKNEGFGSASSQEATGTNETLFTKFGKGISAASTTMERSSATDIVPVAAKKTRWGKKWEELKEKARGHSLFKRVRGITEHPALAKGQELAEDIRERWETSDSPVVHKIQDLNETIFGESAAAISYKEIRRRDPSFSLPDFIADVQEIIKPTLQAYLKGDLETLKKNCSFEVIDRCKAERRAYESQGIFFDHKILHISDVEVKETKLMGNVPIIIIAFQTQQIFCVRDGQGKITEGGKDDIHTVYYAWAMQQMDAGEMGEGELYPTWRLREMQQLGIQALI